MSNQVGIAQEHHAHKDRRFLMLWLVCCLSHRCLLIDWCVHLLNLIEWQQFVGTSVFVGRSGPISKSEGIDVQSFRVPNPAYDRGAALAAGDIPSTMHAFNADR